VHLPLSSNLNVNVGFQKLKAYNNVDSEDIEINSLEANIGFSCDLFGFILAKLTVGNAYLNFNKIINNDYDTKYSFYIEPAIGIHLDNKSSFVLSYKDYSLSSQDLNGYNALYTYNF